MKDVKSDLNIVGDHADVRKSFDSHPEIVFTLPDPMLLVDDADAEAEVEEKKNEADDDDDDHGNSGLNIQSVRRNFFRGNCSSGRRERGKGHFYSVVIVKVVFTVRRGSGKSG